MGHVFVASSALADELYFARHDFAPVLSHASSSNTFPFNACVAILTWHVVRQFMSLLRFFAAPSSQDAVGLSGGTDSGSSAAGATLPAQYRPAVWPSSFIST